MHDEWTVAERSLWIFGYLSQGDRGKSQKSGPQKDRNFSAVYKSQFSITSKTFVDTKNGTTERKT